MAAAAALTLAIAPAIGQGRKSGPIVPITFTSPDGSRFVLIPTGDAAQVHWAVATHANAGVNPAGLEGLATVVQLASLGGTWATGSEDADLERETLAALDRAYADLLAKPGDAALMGKVRGHEELAKRQGDDTVFTRVLAAAPAHNPTVSVRGSIALLELTTVPSAIAIVGALLVERREQQALRGLAQHWLAEVARRQNAFDKNPLATVHAELLALALPNHPETRAAERPGRVMPRRAQAISVWNATQHPQRTVHLLYGGFEAEAARKVLKRVFATTALPTPAPINRATPRPVASLRRSMVPATGRSILAIAWILPPIGDPFALVTAARWLGGGPTSQLAKRLSRSGRKTAMVRCTAPWPISVDGRSLLLIEVEDPAGTEGLADLVIQMCKDITAKVPSAGSLHGELMAIHRNWTAVTAEPRWLVAETAKKALLWPHQKVRVTYPTKVAPKAVHALLTAVFAGKPVIVEGQP